MREIMFRAKQHKDYGEAWVYGVPFIDYAGDCIMKNDASESVVNPDTVGQYTGLADINGTRIFEGDILQVNIWENSPDAGIDRCIVGFGEFEPFSREGVDQVGFYLYWRSDYNQTQKYSNIGYWLRERKAVCVGNIFDNPELLDKEKDK